MVGLENSLSLIKVNVKIWLRKNLLLAVFLMIFTPIIFYIRNVDTKTAATICDIYLSLVGVVMISSIFFPEEKGNVLEVVKSRTLDYSFIYIIRILLAVLSTFCLLAFSIFVLKLLKGDFPYFKFLYGSFATSLYLGAIGIVVVSITNQSIAGYLGSMCYIIIELGTKGKYTKDLYIYAMRNGSFEEKKYVLIVGIILLVVSIIINKIRQNK